MTQASIGVAVVGTGFGQKVHIPGLQAHHRTEVTAVYHRDRAQAEKIAQEYGIPHPYTSLAEILSLDAVQAVTVATPPFLHAEMATAVLEAGKHLLLEKPMTLRAAETEQLAALAQRQGVVAVPDFEFRFIPAWQRFAELLAEGYVGQKRLVKIDWLASSRANPERGWNWYAQKARGGGALGSIGSHMFDYVAWLFGPVQRLQAQLSTSIPNRPDPASGEQKPVDSDDTCALTLLLADGTPCQVTLSAVAYAGRGHWLEVYGDRGTLVLGNSSQTDYVNGFQLLASKKGAALEPVPIPERLAFPKIYQDGRIAPFIRVVDHWVSCIDAGRPSSPSLQDGFYSQLLMDLTHRSHETQQWVDVPRRS